MHAKFFGHATIGALAIFSAVASLAMAWPSIQTAVGSGAGTASTGAASSPVADVKGFRSAHFGMDETAVRSAIAADFGSSAKIKPIANATERTHGLTVHVPDVLPGGGAADVSYVFGYKGKTLIQISVVWSKTTDPSLTNEKLVADADVLKTSFLEQGYKSDSIVTDSAVKGGILVFRGADPTGHTTALLLEGRVVADKDRRTFTPQSLLLLYMVDPKHADVFRLAPGQF